MAYSGTTAKTKITVDQLVSYAFRDAGKTAEEITPELIGAAKQALFYILQNMSNKGVNLWMLENVLIGTTADQTVLTLPEGTIDVREANWRYIVTPQIAEALPVDNYDAPALFDQNLSTHATSTIFENWFGASYQDSQRMFQVGFNAYCPGTTATYNLVLETSEDGITWTERESFPETILADGQWAYFPVDPSTPHNFYRVRETVEDTFSLRQLVFSYTQQDIPLARLNRDDYWNLPNKQFPSQRPLQYWFNRQIDPQMYLWPIPNNDFQVFQLVLEKQIMDVGSLTNQIYVPDRWIYAVQAMLSHKLSMQIPGVDPSRTAYLEGVAKEAEYDAAQEERDKSPIYFQPNYSYYTR